MEPPGNVSIPRGRSRRGLRRLQQGRSLSRARGVRMDDGDRRVRGARHGAEGRWQGALREATGDPARAGVQDRDRRDRAADTGDCWTARDRHTLLDWIKELPEADRGTAELTVNSILTPSLTNKYGWAAKELGDMASRSLEILSTAGHSPYRVPTLWWVVMNRLVAGNSGSLAELAPQPQTMAKKTAEPGAIAASEALGCLTGSGAWMRSSPGRCAFARPRGRSAAHSSQRVPHLPTRPANRSSGRLSPRRAWKREVRRAVPRQRWARRSSNRSRSIEVTSPRCLLPPESWWARGCSLHRASSP